MNEFDVRKKYKAKIYFMFYHSTPKLYSRSAPVSRSPLLIKTADSCPLPHPVHLLFVCLQVLNSGPSRSLDTVVDIALPKMLAPHRHRLLQVVDWQVRSVLATAVSATVTEGEETQSVQNYFLVYL